MYDTEVTEHGNPEALKRIAEELQERVFTKTGDLYRGPSGSEDGYHVWVIMYEGVGSSGSDHVALISRVFLTEEEYALYGATFLAHEFYHTLGIPDGYDLTDGTPYFDDLMGLGRTRPLEHTYIRRETISHLGL